MPRREDGGEDGPEREASGSEDTTYRGRSGTDLVSTSVVRAVAAVTGKEPVDIQPLYDVVDADALDDLFSPATGDGPRTTGHVSFFLEGVDVTVHASGEIVIDAPA